MTSKKKIWGIQKKVLIYTASLLLLALFLSCVGVAWYSQRKLEAVTTDKYNFLCEKSGLSLQALYEKTDKKALARLLEGQEQADNHHLCGGASDCGGGADSFAVYRSGGECVHLRSDALPAVFAFLFHHL